MINKTRTSIFLTVITVMLLVLAACARTQGLSSPAMDRETAEGALVAGEESAPMEPGFDSDDNTIAFQVGAQVPQTRLIIRTGNMAVVVSDTEAAMESIAAMTEANGGWVVSSSRFQSGVDGALSGSMTVRIPAEGFDSALEAIRLLAVEVTSEETSGQDVTEEFVDLSARLSNLEATAERVRQFLDEARNVEEALAVNQELSRLESEIEVIKGRMQYLEQSAAYSTITVRLTPDELAQPLQVAGWQPEGVAKNALEALISGLQTLANVLIWLVIFCLPLVLIFGIPIALALYLWRWRGRRKATAAAAASAEPEANATPEA